MHNKYSMYPTINNIGEIVWMECELNLGDYYIMSIEHGKLTTARHNAIILSIR